jgi:hypothetical protein
MRPEHAAGGDLAETGEHLVEKFDEVAHIGCSWGDVKRKAGMKHYSWLGAEIKKPRCAWLFVKLEKNQNLNTTPTLPTVAEGVISVLL